MMTSYAIDTDQKSEELLDGMHVYQREIPKFVASELERLYSNIYCTLDRIKIYEDIGDISTYVAFERGVPKAIILFRKVARTVSVVNQQVKFSGAELNNFVKEIFQRYADVTAIKFYALDMGFEEVNYPALHFRQLQENVILLPATPEEYTQKLRPAFRHKMNNALRRIKRDDSSFKFQIFEKEKIKESVVRETIELAAKRMQVKGKPAYIAEEELGRLTKLLRSHGSVSIMTIKESLVAGNIWFTVGRRHFMQIAAHDPAYDKYMLGNQIKLLTFLHCISLSGQECWLMGGGQQNKEKFLTTVRDLNSGVIFRSKIYMIINWRLSSYFLAKSQFLLAKTTLRELFTRCHTALSSASSSLALIQSRIKTMGKRNTK